MPHLDDRFVPTFAGLPAEIHAAMADAPIPSLTAGPVAPELAALLKNSSLQKPLGKLPPLAVSGLWLLAGDLDRSHTLSQDDSSAAGSFWHGIMHRREGDYSNAAYWFRRVGSHRVIEQLAVTYPDDYRDPDHFIDAIAAACGARDAEAIGRLERIQWTEWQLLMQDCLLV